MVKFILKNCQPISGQDIKTVRFKAEQQALSNRFKQFVIYDGLGVLHIFFLFNISSNISGYKI